VIRVLLADDQPLVRTGLRTIFDSDASLEVVGEAANGAEAVTMSGALRPDVVLLDVRMPVTDGLAAARRLLADPAPPKVLMLTTFHVDDDVYEALRVGASGYLLKDAAPDDLIAAVRAAAAGDVALAPAVTRSLVDHFVRRGTRAAPAAPQGWQELTSRELEVLGWLGRGATNAEIMAGLHLSLSTVKTHVASILQKLELRDRVQAAILAAEQGLA
jgi:DNA-binding NarL/FixJ family response regulator